jgi:DNA-binding transcriptional LysR family regulator
MDRLEHLSIFVAVAERQSLVRAARQLGLSAAAVTRALAALEARIGARLLLRTTRSVKLTDAGRTFLPRAREILALVREAEQEAAGEREVPQGRLTVTASMTFGRLHVAPLLLAFLRANPAVTGSLMLADNVVNLVDQGVDVAFRLGELPDSSLVARRIGMVRRILVASPEYLARKGVPAHPADLARHDVISFGGAFGPDSFRLGREEDWRDVTIRPRLQVNDAVTAVASAVAGDGIAVAVSYVVADELRRGALVAVLEPYCPRPVPVHAVTPEGRLMTARVRHFLDYAVPRLVESVAAVAIPEPAGP